MFLVPVIASKLTENQRNRINKIQNDSQRPALFVGQIYNSTYNVYLIPLYCTHIHWFSTQALTNVGFTVNCVHTTPPSKTTF